MSRAERSEICRLGKKYVTPAEFARRMDVSRMAITYALRDGRLQGTQIDGYKKPYLEWETQSNIWQELQSRERAGQPTRKKRKEIAGETTTELPFDDTSLDEGRNYTLESLGQNLSKLKVTNETIEKEKVGDVTVGKDVVTLLNINPEQFADCYCRSANGELKLDINGNYIIDWKMADIKIKALIHQQQLDKERGKLIELNEAEEMIGLAFSPVSEMIKNIPDKFFSRISSWVENKIGVTFSNSDKSEIKSILSEEIDKSLRDLQRQLSEIMQ